MTNEKQELFATLGLIAEESVNEVKKEEPEVEKTCLESVEAELAELDSIDKSNEEVEKASFESLVSDLDLLNQILAYKSIKTAGTEEAALESISTEFGIANEGVKELASKGVNAIKALIDKLISALKKLFSVNKTQEKVIKSLEYKINAVAEANKGKYDLKLFAVILGHEMILAGLTNKGFSSSDFPNAGSFSKITKIAKDAIEGFYKGSPSDGKDNYTSFIGDLNEITKGLNDIETEAKNVTDLSDFDYHQGAVKLIKAFRMYNVGKKIQEIISSLEKEKAKIDQKLVKGKLETPQDGVNQVNTALTGANLSSALKTINKYKDINSKNVRALVKLCGQYLKAAKSVKTEKSA